MSNKSKFSKAPLSPEEKERKAENFLNFESNKTKLEMPTAPAGSARVRVLKKEPVKVLSVRFPQTLAEDVAEISALTGVSINAICIELLRPAVKSKLKELTEN